MALPLEIAANWPALSPLLDEALELAPEKRTAWLAGLPQEHWQFRTRLRSLLANEPEPLLDEPASNVVGPWRLVEKIGEGGMAEVWMAERSDGLLLRPVALKLPRKGWGNALFCQRLARERDILDTLQHRNIARLLDAGMTPSGQPFLVLEYVAGERIDWYCQSHKLSIQARLDLFLQVAEAIAFAHHSLVLHRDLKPSNILVTNEGAIRVLDFGIAKLLEFGRTEQTDLTLYAGPALTLDYASPEQIAGEPLTVSSDVYSLGVVLYELLTGTRPYRLKRRSGAGLEQQILEIEPPPPSKIAGDNELRRAIQGDLDSIVMMALRKRPQARYLSVESFAEDVQRYLQKRPVLARPNGPSYRASMFIRRHRLVFLYGTLLLLVLIATSAVTASQARTAFAQRKQALEAKALVISMLFDAHSYWGTGKPVSALDMLRQTQHRLMTFPVSDTKTQVQVLDILGASLLSQEDLIDAETAIHRAAQEAVKLPSSDPERLRSRLLVNWIFLSRGRTDRIRPNINHLLEDMRHFGSAFPEDFAGAWRIRSAVALAEGDSGMAISSALASQRIAELRLGMHHNQSVLALVDLSYAYSLVGREDLAVKTAEQAVQRGLQAYSNSQTHPNVLKARIAWASALTRSGQPARGIPMVQAAIADVSALFGASSLLVGQDLAMLAEMQMHDRQWIAARQSMERAHSILAGYLCTDSPAYISLARLRSEIELGARKKATPSPDFAMPDRNTGCSPPRPKRTLARTSPGSAWNSYCRLR